MKSQYVCGAMWTGISARRVFRCHSTWSLLWAGVKPRSRYDHVNIFSVCRVSFVLPVATARAIAIILDRLLHHLKELPKQISCLHG